MASIDKPSVVAICERVRADDDNLTWTTLKYNESNTIVPAENGDNFDDILGCFGSDERVYAYVRVTTGDDLSVRAKFAFLTFIGPDVTPMKKAKCSTDKANVKGAIGNFTSEFVYDDLSEIKYEKILETVRKAGGANYDAQA